MVGSGSRSLAMGRSGVALVDDASALFWNPARLSWSQWPEIQLFRSQLFDDGISYHSGFFSYPTEEQGTLSLGYARLGVDSIERRDARNFLLGDFDSSESHLLAGYGRRLRPDLAVGFTGRLVQQDIGGSAAVGIGIDLGVAWERPVGSSRSHRLGLGMNLQNAIEPRLRLDQEDVVDPRNLKLGAAYRGAPASSRLSWALASDIDLTHTGETRWGTGLEIALDRLLMIRVGADGGRFTSGFALAARGITVEYAMLDAEDLSRNDRFSLRWTFGLSVDDRRTLRKRDREAAVQRELGSLLEERERQARDEARARADEAYRLQDWTSAHDLYRRVLLISPDDSAARSRLRETERRLLIRDALDARKKGQLARTMNLYKDILERWPQDPEALEGLETVRQTLRAAEDHQAQVEALFRHSLGLFADGDLIGTRNSLDELLQLDPQHALGLELRARTESLRLKRGEDALRSARSSFAAGRYDSALKDLSLAHHLLPERAEELRALHAEWTAVREAAQRRRVAEATQLSQTKSPEPSPSRRQPLSAAETRELAQAFQRGLVSFQAGHFDRAISQWQRVWDRSPGFERVGEYLVKANLLQGIQLYSQGDYTAAMNRCRRVLEIDPQNPKAKRYLDRIREEQQELQQLRGE